VKVILNILCFKLLFYFILFFKKKKTIKQIQCKNQIVAHHEYFYKTPTLFGILIFQYRIGVLQTPSFRPLTSSSGLRYALLTKPYDITKWF